MFVNQFAARHVFELPFNRPVLAARRLPCPWLLQICITDRVAPASAAERAVRRADYKVEVRRYPMGHFDIYTIGFEQAVQEQVAFLAGILLRD
jgi:uncharacterized protein